MIALTEQTLALDNIRFRGTAGVSEHRPRGFSPAFMDTETRRVYPSRFADGRLAPIHLLQGLPDEVLIARHSGGREVKASVVAGFLFDGRFYTRAEAASHAASRTDPARQ